MHKKKKTKKRRIRWRMHKGREDIDREYIKEEEREKPIENAQKKKTKKVRMRWRIHKSRGEIDREYIQEEEEEEKEIETT